MTQSSLNDTRIAKEQIDVAMRLCELKEYSQAETYIKTLLAQQPRNSQLWYLLSFVFAQQKQYSQAIELIKKAIEYDPQETSFYSNLGNIYLNLKQYNNAIQCYQQAIQINPEEPSFYKSLGFVCGLQGNMAAANFHYGMNQEKQGNLAEAIKCYQKAIQVDPSYALIFYRLGYLYQKSKDFESAVECYQKATQLKPDYVDAYYQLGLTYQQQELLPQAIYNYEQAIKLKPNYGEAHLNLSILYKEQGNLAKAFNACQNAIQYQAETANSFYPLGYMISEEEEFSNLNSSETVFPETEAIDTEEFEITTDFFDLQGSFPITDSQLQNAAIESKIAKQKAKIVPDLSQVKEITKSPVAKAEKSDIVADRSSKTNNKIKQKDSFNDSIYREDANFLYLEKELISHRFIDNKYSFLITISFTNNYLKNALYLLDYLTKTECSYCLWQIPTGHQSFLIEGDIAEFNYTKPNYLASIYDTLITKQLNLSRSEFTHILYLDYRALSILKPETIDYIQKLCDCNIDFAVYNHLQKNTNLTTIKEKNESSLLISASEIQLYSLSENSLLIWQAWQQAIVNYMNNSKPKILQVFPEDKIFLDYAWNDYLRYQKQIDYSWLSSEYCSQSKTPLATTLIK